VCVLPPQITGVAPATRDALVAGWPDPAAGAGAGFHEAYGEPVHDPQGPHDPHGQHDPYEQHVQDAYDPRATGQWTFPEAVTPEPGPAPGHAPAHPHAPAAHDVTGQWSIPVANGDLPDESGEFTASSLAQQWGGTPPATLPGGAPAPWAHLLDQPVVEQPPVEQLPVEQPSVEPPAAEETPFERTAKLFVVERRPDGSLGPRGGVPEEAAEPQPLVAPEPLVVPESLVVPEPQPVSAPEPVIAPEPVAAAPEPQPSAAPEPEPEPEPEPAPEESAEAPAPEAEAEPEPVEPEPAPEPAPAPESEAIPPAEAEAETAVGTATVVEAATDVQETEAEAEPEPEPERHPQADAEVDAAVEVEIEAEQPEAGAGPPQPLHDEHPLVSYVLRVNGADRPVTEAWIGESLLYVLRERLGLAGAKDGCSQGECGACNVQVDGRLVASCLVPAATTAGSEVRTVEGLAADGQPSDVQRALANCGAVQCGFCVPGMAMTLHDLLEGNPAPSELETRRALCGNLCRCSGYRGVLDAVRDVVAERAAKGAAEQEQDEQTAGQPHIPHQAGPYGQDGDQA
ncbi:2Fe-2S iron-sulfur cluster-binding protein, partial [Streptomyces spectabilis]